MRTGNPLAALLVAVLATGAVLADVGATVGQFRADRRPLHEPLAKPVAARAAQVSDDPAYRLGYASTDEPGLFRRGPGRLPTGELPLPLGGRFDYDADVTTRGVVWISRRPAAGQAEPDGEVYLLLSGTSTRGDTGTPVRITNDRAAERYPALSPDATRIAFTSDRGGSNDIWVINANGSGLRQLTTHPGEDTWPSWSPDGTEIAFSSTRDDPAGDIYVVSAAGGTPRRITSDPAADTEPAWSPDGTRIAFTTTRFSPSGDVVTMPAAGGQVRRVLPATIDSAQPAWAADSRRLAVVSHHSDRAGGVYVVDGSTAVQVTDNPGRVEEHPTWAADQVIYTGIAVASASDVWSSDPAGHDRRDLSNRPGVDEHGPAFSPDGLHLAYSAEYTDGSARIVVADADGRNPKILAPPGTLATDRDLDPAWSPNGSMIAFSRVRSSGTPELATRPSAPGLPSTPGLPGGSGTSDGTATQDGPTGSEVSCDPDDPDPGPIEVAPAATAVVAAVRILVMRSGDGALVGEMPVPPALTTDDMEPTWSPEGDRIAIARTSRRSTSDLSNPRVDRQALPNSEFTVSQRVPTPTIPAQPDILFLLDRTSSMDAKVPHSDGTVFSQLKANIVDVMNDVNDEVDGARFGLATFTARGADGEYDDDVYALCQGLTDQTELMAGAVGALKVEKRYSEENWFYALMRITGDVPGPGFRTDGSKIVVLISDTWSRDKTDPRTGAPISYRQVLNALLAKGIYLIGVPVAGTNEDGLDDDGLAGQLATSTGGKLTRDSTPDEMIAEIKRGIRQLTLSVSPVVEHCDQGLAVTFDPKQARVPAGTSAEFAETVSVDAKAVPGSELHCTVRFDVASATPQASSRQEIIVHVAQPGRPLVRVDDVTVTARDSTGARVTYSASAVDVTGRPLPPPRCTPPSGSVFPIGQTIVTCTSTGAGGRTGTDTALITVLDPTGDASTRIWVVDVRAGTDGMLSFGNQRDLSSRVGDVCHARVSDRGPAWSPDGKSIAFAAMRQLCVVASDSGAGARTPLSGADANLLAADPAWSPDGAELAFSVDPGGEFSPNSIYTVPANGGPATVRIGGPGNNIEPVYQPLPTPDLRLSVTVGPQPGYVGGDDLTVTYTVRNDSSRPAANAWLAVDLPAELTPTTTDSRCSGQPVVCNLGALGVGDQVVVTYLLHPVRAATSVVSGRLTATVGQRVPATRQAQAPVVVLQPVLRLDPPIGPPGFVSHVIGSNFPPGATVRLTWQPGITAAPNTVVVGPDGTFIRQQLIMRKDVLGPRDLRATWVSGPATFGPVSTRFLVVARALDPPIFDGRR